MSKEVPWDSYIVRRFNELACLTDEEKLILKTRVEDNWTITKQCLEFGMSRSKVNRVIARLKQKYDKIQKYDDKLPERKSSVQETYMDEN